MWRRHGRRTVADMPIDVVIAGAGPAALETALALPHHAPHHVALTLLAAPGPAPLEPPLPLRHPAPAHVALTLLAPAGDSVSRPVSVAEPFALGSARRYPLGAISADLHAAHMPGTLAAIDAAAHEVHLQ